MFRLACLFYCLTALALQRDNIPQPENEINTIEFCVTRDPYGFLKPSLLRSLKSAFQIDEFIETGTYLGDTAFVAASIFPKVHTIELSFDLYEKALARFSPYTHMKVYQGDSGDILPYVLENVSGKALFYLDGHFTPGTAKGIENTPLLRELGAIRDAELADALILIDDIRFFQPSLRPNKLKPLALEDYPNLSQIVATLLQINPDYQICFLGDALLAFPKTVDVSVSPLVTACAMHRLEELCPDLTKEDLLQADRIIAEASSKERKVMEEYFESYCIGEMELGYRSYGALWLALMLKQLGLEQQSQELISKAAENSLPGWRIDYFR